MMLKTSSRNLNPAFGMYKSTLRKYAGISVLMCIGVLLYCPGYFVANPIIDEYSIGFVNRAQTFMSLLAIFSCAAVMLLNLIGFLFLYSKRSSDVFHSLPLTRSELLLSRILAGLTLSLIPLIVGYISLSVLNCFSVEPISFIIILKYFSATVCFMLVCSAISAFFAICAGSAFDLAVSFISANVGLVLTALIVMNILGDFLIGYSFGNEETILNWLSPYVYFVDYLIDLEIATTAETVSFYVYCAVLLAAFGISTVVLYNRRKAERGGQAYAFKFMYFACSFLLAVCGSYGLGIIFGEGTVNTVFWIFAVAGGILASIIYGVISKRGFKNIKSAIITGAVATATIAAITLISITGGFGYKNRVPDTVDVASVCVELNSCEIIFKDADMPVDIHSEILDGKLYERRNGAYVNTVRIDFDYAFNNGKTVKRTFFVNTEDKAGQQIVEQLYRCDERYETFLEVVRSSKDNVVSVYGDKIDDSCTVTKAEVESIIAIYREELIDAEKTAAPIYDYGSDCEYYNFGLSDFMNWDYCDIDIYVNEKDFPKTIEYINSLKLEERVYKPEK